MKNKLIAIAKRENNAKRSFLIVNKLQGKHIPVSPTKSLNLFSELSSKINVSKNTLVVGFCETATAIGMQIAKELSLAYIHTTRENYSDMEYMFFSEEHSHATEQKLLKSEIDKIINDIDEILFIEDEITTGQTILNIIKSFENHYSKKLKFSVAAVINGMNSENTNRFLQKNINVYYILATDSLKYDDKILNTVQNGRIYDLFSNDFDPDNSFSKENLSRKSEYDNLNISYSSKKSIIDSNCPDIVKHYDFSGLIDNRKLSYPQLYIAGLENLFVDISDILSKEKLPPNSRILVLGTEEFMYPAIFVGSKLESWGFEVFTHSTTRSPIAVSLDKNYPLHTRYEIISPYEKERKTFIYNLDKYDLVFVLSESIASDFSTVIEALKISGNDKIRIVRWC